MEKTIVISDNKKIEAIAFSDILHLESEGMYTTIFCKNNRRIVYSKPLKNVLSKLDSSIFFRVHKSHCVNLYEVRFYEKGRGGNIMMSDGSIIPIAYLKKAAFLLCYFKIMTRSEIIHTR